MGVRRLLKILEKYDYSPLEEIPIGSLLLVDGSAFLINLIKKLPFDKTYHGGDYLTIDNIVENEINSLRKLGFELQVYFDGPASKFKNFTKTQRNFAKENDWMNWYIFCMHKTKRGGSFPLPVLGFTQFEKTLNRLNVKTIFCKYEADVQMALDCSSYDNNKKTNVYCYGKDTDFCVMKNSSYIQLDSITYNSDTKKCYAVVYRRKSISEFFKLKTEMEFVQICVFLGNDFTVPFDDTCTLEITSTIEQDDDKQTKKEKITKITSKQRENGLNYFRLLLSIIPSLSNINSANSNYLKAINYSLSFYNLDEQLLKELEQEEVPVEENEVVLPESVNFEQQFKNLLTTEEERIFTSFLEKITTNVNSSMEISTGKQIISLIKIIKRNSPFLYFTKITDVHLIALENMLNYLTQEEAVVPSFKQEEEVSPDWDDILVSQCYQSICRLVYRHEKKLFLEKKILLSEPKYLFHGQYFHYELSKMKVTSFSPMQMENDVSSSSSSQKQTLLPIDEHREEIVTKIMSNRITIIHGETGCGKSTRIPLFVYEHCKNEGSKCKMMISQPRRIGASSLMSRLRSIFKNELNLSEDLIGLRMGHNTREESKNTIMWFVTTGYLVQRLANDVDSLGTFTHLIIDEVHERSIEGDLVCLLAKRALQRYPKLHLILMSATANTSLYQEYFYDEKLKEVPCLTVGSKCYENEIYFLDDLLQYYSNNNKASSSNVPLPKNSVSSLLNVLSKRKNKREISMDIINAQLQVASNIVKLEKGIGILIFVSGIAAIIELCELLEGIPKIKLFAIHSEIPFEEQTEIFTKTKSNETKVIIATEAAESSITVPEIDLVICLGTHKSLEYDEKRHSTLLENIWISKSSAIQRAGRTGRVRPGRVIRLYTKDMYTNEFSLHCEPQILRIPLDNTIITLHSIFERDTEFNGIIPILTQLIDTPNITRIQNSFNSLFSNQLISSPNDVEGKLTVTGRLTNKLGLDVKYIKMITIGILLNVGQEIAIIISGLSQQKSIFRHVTASVISSGDVKKELLTLRAGLYAQDKLDDGTYSEAIVLLQIFKIWHYIQQSASKNIQRKMIKYFIAKFQINESKMKLFYKHALYFLEKIQKCIGEQNPSSPSYDLSNNQIFFIRLALLWGSDGKLIQLDPTSTTINSFDLNGPSTLSKKILAENLFPKMNFFISPNVYMYDVFYDDNDESIVVDDQMGKFLPKVLEKVLLLLDIDLIFYLTKTDSCLISKTVPVNSRFYLDMQEKWRQFHSNNLLGQIRRATMKKHLRKEFEEDIGEYHNEMESLKAIFIFDSCIPSPSTASPQQQDEKKGIKYEIISMNFEFSTNDLISCFSSTNFLKMKPENRGCRVRFETKQEEKTRMKREDPKIGLGFDNNCTLFGVKLAITYQEKDIIRFPSSSSSSKSHVEEIRLHFSNNRNQWKPLFVTKVPKEEEEQELKLQEGVGDNFNYSSTKSIVFVKRPSIIHCLVNNNNNKPIYGIANSSFVISTRPTIILSNVTLIPNDPTFFKSSFCLYWMEIFLGCKETTTTTKCRYRICFSNLL